MLLRIKYRPDFSKIDKDSRKYYSIHPFGGGLIHKDSEVSECSYVDKTSVIGKGCVISESYIGPECTLYESRIARSRVTKSKISFSNVYDSAIEISVGRWMHICGSNILIHSDLERFYVYDVNSEIHPKDLFFNKDLSLYYCTEDGTLFHPLKTLFLYEELLTTDHGFSQDYVNKVNNWIKELTKKEKENGQLEEFYKFCR